ncbi:hypothetical protein ACQUY5_18730 [Bacillus cereus]|uniref:hypothetical protein n=1 Tax=Bacillus cereus TaxID=1396 RepID=UPI003D17B0DE
MSKVVSNYILSNNGELQAIQTGKVYGAVSHVAGGKTTFCTKTVHKALVQYGVDVLFWTLEGATEYVLASVRACHFNYMYEKLGYKPLTGHNILNDEFPTEEHKELEAKSREDLAKNEKYGYLRAFASTPYIDLLESKLQELTTEVDYKLIAFDGLDLVLNEDGERNHKEVVESAFNIVLDFVEGKNVAILSTNQRPIDTRGYVSLENRLNKPNFVEIDLDKVQF